MSTTVSRSSDTLFRTPAVMDRAARPVPINGGNTSARPGARPAPELTGRSSFSPAANGSRPATSTSSLRPGDESPAVLSLQNRLRSAGFDPGRSDGKFGWRTENAVRDFQRTRGLEVDGVAGRRTLAALNGPDRMDANRPTTNGGVTGTNRTDANRPTANGGVNGTARLNGQPGRPGMTTGNITVNGRTYQFNSGSSRDFSVPQGTYRVVAHRNNRSERGFTRDGVGFSFRLEDPRRPNSDKMYDARAGRDRTALRIHPDGGGRGTAGCIGLVGDAATLNQFRADMNEELRRNGGVYTLRVQ